MTKALLPALGALLGLTLALVLTLVVFGLPVADSLRLIWEGSVGSSGGWMRTAVKATPLMLMGLGMAVAWRAGMYNIGGEGQFLAGALGGAAAAKFLTAVPALALKPLVLASGFVWGGLFALIAGWLLVKRGVNVVISTILLNFVAIQLFEWALTGPLQEAKGRTPQTDRLPEAMMLFRFDRQNDLHSGVLIALIAVVVVYAILFLTPTGFRIRLAGENPQAARANRIPPGRYQLVAMALSGGLCGLAASVEFLGITGQLAKGFNQQLGFIAIPVALLGNLHPVGVGLSAVYFGGLFAGSENLARFSNFGTTVMFVIQGAAVLAYVGVRTVLERRQLAGAEVES